MARISVDISDEIYSGLIDEGQYVAQVSKIEVTQVKASAMEAVPRNQLFWVFKTSWNEKEVQLVRFTPLSGKGVSFTRDILVALGAPFEESGDRIAFDSDDCMGKSCGVTVKHDTNDGKTRNSVSAFFRV